MHVAKVQPLSSDLLQLRQAIFLQSEAHTSSLRLKLCRALQEELAGSRARSAPQTAPGIPPGARLRETAPRGKKCRYRSNFALLVNKKFRNRKKGEMHRRKRVFTLQLSFCLNFQVHFIAFLSLFSLLLIFSVPTLSSDQLKLFSSAHISTVVVSS